MQRNITALYLIKFAKWFMVIMPVVALYYSENGLQVADLFILKSIYSMSTGLMEIPSGYFADVLGRKKTLALGTVLGTLGFALYSSSYGFAGFVVAEILLGIGQSFISGADSALLYDSLKSLNKTSQFLKFEGRITALGNYAETVAIVLGGVLAAAISVRSVYIAQTLIMFVGIPAALMIKEPERDRPPLKNNIRAIFNVGKYSVFDNQVLGSSILLSSVIGLATLAMAWGTQVYLVDQGFSEVGVTSMLVALNFTVALVALFPHKINALLTPKFSLLVIVVGIPAGYLALGVLPVYLALGVLFLFYAIRGIATPILKDNINKNCGSEYRATVLSFRSLLIRVGFAMLGASMSAVSGLTTARGAFLYAFFVLSAAVFFSAFWFFRARYPKRTLLSVFYPE